MPNGPRRPKPPSAPRSTEEVEVALPSSSLRAIGTELGDDEITGPLDLPARPLPASAIVVVIKPASAMPGHRYTLAREEYVVGRRLDCDIALDVGSVSRRHARLVRQEGAYWVEDLRSSNGTWVNDDQVTSRKRLHDGDMIRFGEAVLRFLAGTNIEVQYHEEIYRLAILDGLTGVHNKRFFHEVLEREVAHTQRHGSALSLLMADLDRFKLINDTWGHPAGDVVLQQLCRRVKARIRKDDMIARVGGEEFAFLLVDTPHEGAMTFAEQVRDLISHEPFIYEGKEIAVTLSIGVATISATASPPAAAQAEPARGAGDLLKRADTNLYAAKAAGRNRVVG
jgi:diguanylate cyclase (GGDEF)-like protein